MITASIVPKKERSEFYPSITNNFPYLKRAVCKVSFSIFEGYNGACWEFIKLSNGGYFAYPDINTLITVVSPDSKDKHELSAEAAGLCVWWFVFGSVSRLASEYNDSVGATFFTEHQRKLIEFANEHAEKDKIFHVLHQAV
ncbi:antirestriction protein [Vibrio parahaemolyticus]|nr:antirestriction protein [Vibrio parahaemolyticus]